MTNPSMSDRDLTKLAPKFRQAVEAAIAECGAKGYPVKVAEALRSQERQAYLYAQGRTRPGPRVTNAATNLTSWHGYGLAVDIIHATAAYNPPGGEAWFRMVAQIFKQHGCAWGGDWSHPDTPHMQWGGMPASPAAAHKAAKQRNGNPAVWAMVGANDGPTATVAPPAPASRPILRKGDSGDDVRAMQARLAVYAPGVKADGVFGPATEAAVVSFQNGNGLARDGIVGPATWRALGI